MNKRLRLCGLIFCMIMIVVITYYAKLGINLNQNSENEQQMLEDIKYVILQEKSTEDEGNIVQDANIVTTKEIEGIDINSETNNTIPPQKKKNKDKLPSGFDCIISIPSISLEKIVYTGNLRDKYLSQYDLITATDDMKYGNGGNYIVCGHYSQLYGQSLNRLKEVDEGEYVYINSHGLLHKYIVNSIEFQTMTDTSSYCIQTEKRELTIISCAKYIGPDKYIVIKCELVN